MSLALIFEAVGRSQCQFGDVKNIWTILNLSASFIGYASVMALWFLLNFVTIELYAPQLCVTAFSWMSIFGNTGGLLGPVFYMVFDINFSKIGKIFLTTIIRSVSTLYRQVLVTVLIFHRHFNDMFVSEYIYTRNSW